MFLNSTTKFHQYFRLGLLATSLFVSEQAKADNNCDRLNLPPVQDGSLLYNKSGIWKEIPNVQSLAPPNGATRTYRFIYVSKGNPGERGVIVVKAGNEVARADAPQLEGVKLRRKRTLDDNGLNCSAPGRHAFAAKVKGINYDRYHDQGLNRSEDASKLKAFHIPYVRRNGACAFTDDLGNGNRAKFSFDQSVSNSGRLYSKLNFFKSAFAGNRLMLRQVDMEPYRINEDGRACLSFNLKVNKTTILRIIDLER